MSVAPEGREGVFTAMASAPLFLGKFVTGVLLRVLVSSCCSAAFLTIKVVDRLPVDLHTITALALLLLLLLLHKVCVSACNTIN